MKVTIILNGISRRKKQFYQHIFPVLKRNFETQILETQSPGHAFSLAQQISNREADVLLSAGGDGTLNQVLNGLLNKQSNLLPILGVIPLGTGNDFARMCKVKPDGNQIAEMITSGKFQSTDVGKIVCSGYAGEEIVRYFINVCSVGMGPEVVQRLTHSNRSLGPTLTYFKAIVQTFFSHKPQPLVLQTDLWSWTGNARVVAIANGQSFGSGLFIAPDADPADGELNVFVAGDLPLLKFLLYQQALKGKKKVNDPKIRYAISKAIKLSSEQKTIIEAEGEIQGYLPAVIEAVPQAIRILR